MIEEIEHAPGISDANFVRVGSVPGHAEHLKRNADKERRAARHARAERLAAAQAQLERDIEALETFREEARRAGVPPGWIRED